MSMHIYRKLWIEHYGPIPIDEDGRTYEIHHKDGNHKNNVLDNLACVSIKEHFIIHESQGDWAACSRIAMRMSISPMELKQKLSDCVQKRLKSGNHPFVKGLQQKRLADGTHHFLDPKFYIKQMKKGIHQSQIIRTCPNCGHTGKGNAMKQWHFENCKKK